MVKIRNSAEPEISSSQTREACISAISSINKDLTESKIKEIVDSLEKDIDKMCLPFQAIDKLGENQFTVLEELTLYSIVRVCKLTNLDEFLLKKSQKGEIFDVNKSISVLQSHPRLEKYKTGLDQSIAGFYHNFFYLSALGFLAILDGLLSDVTDKEITNIKKRLCDLYNHLSDQFLKNKVLSEKELSDSYTYLSLIKTTELLSENSDFKKNEPSTINRHWIMHGRSKRNISQLDCIKLIRLIHGMLRLSDILSEETTNN